MKDFDSKDSIPPERSNSGSDSAQNQEIELFESDDLPKNCYYTADGHILGPADYSYIAESSEEDELPPDFDRSTIDISDYVDIIKLPCNDEEFPAALAKWKKENGFDDV